MATLGIALKRANILRAGLASWKVKWGYGETPDDAYYSLGALADGEVRINHLVGMNEYGREKPYAMELTAAAKMMCTDKSTVVDLLHKLGDAQLLHTIAAINGKNFQGPFGFKWSFDSSAQYDGYRFVQLNAGYRFFAHHASIEDLDDIISPAPSDGTPDAGDALYTWSATTYIPAGISAITINPAGDAETIGDFGNARFVAELLTHQDYKGRDGGHAIRVSVEADMLQTYEELAYVGNNFPSIDSVVVTFADGMTATLSSQSGIRCEYTLAGGAEDIGRIRLIGGGVVGLSEWPTMIA